MGRVQSQYSDFQEAQVDEVVNVGDNYETHKLGLIRFYMFTKTLTSGDDPEEGADIQTDVQHENTRDTGLEKHTMEGAEQLTQKRHNSEKYKPSTIHTVKDDELSTATMSAVVSTAAIQIIDLTSLCNTSEVIFGLLTGGPFLGDLDDTLIHEPILAVKDEQINTYTSTPIDAEKASARPPSPANELLNVTVKLHRVTL